MLQVTDGFDFKKSIPQSFTDFRKRVKSATSDSYSSGIHRAGYSANFLLSKPLELNGVMLRELYTFFRELRSQSLQ